MSFKHPSPLLGYNNNVRHKGKVFHVQTEDSGVKYGHIMTHLFMDGGRILKSMKASYAEYIGGEHLGDILREMMKEQHKSMIIALRDGKFDAMADGSIPELLAAKKADPGPESTATGAAYVAQQVESVSTKEAIPNSVARGLAATIVAGSPPVLRSDLPSRPASLLREKTATDPYRIVIAPPGPARVLPPAGQAPPPEPPPSSAASERLPMNASPAPAERRYAPTRPASIFGQARPGRGKTLFGEDLVSDKSLDEVILSYLSEDIDAPKK